MPQLNINIGKKLDESTKNKLQLEIGNNMEILPGKNIGNTMICINDGLSMFKNGVPIDGIFTDVRLYKSSPEENKKQFAEKLFSIFENILGVKSDAVYMNFTEMPSWASGGNYF